MSNPGPRRVFIRPKQSNASEEEKTPKKIREDKPFPLYDKLRKKALLAYEKQEEISGKIWPQMSKLDPDNGLIVFFIILHYARLNDDHTIPHLYKIPQGGKGIIYNVDVIPIELRYILAECIKEITS